MRTLGRFTAPVMSLMLAEGYYHTRSKKKYLPRLIIFALISHPVFAYALNLKLYEPPFNFMFTLAIGILALIAYDKLDGSKRIFVIFCLIFISSLCDWGPIAPIWILIFHIFRTDKNKKAAAFTLATAVYLLYNLTETYLSTGSIISQVWQLGIMSALPIIYIYSGERKIKSKAFKLFFYIFYPLHLLILTLIHNYA